jgi:hypothetical protein
VSKYCSRSVYASGGWELSPARGELRLRGRPIPLGSRAFEIIEIMVHSAQSLALNLVQVHDNTLQSAHTKRALAGRRLSQEDGRKS